jgi:arylsulfatase A-like enzyme
MSTELTRKQFFQIGGAVAAAATLGGADTAPASPPATAPATNARPRRAGGVPPNIVLITTDDLGWADLACYGSTFHETPVLDRLAGAGARFTDAYSSAPVCSPSRTALLTGKSPTSIGVTQQIGGFGYGRLRDVPYLAQLPWSEQSLARVLAGAGYHTWHVGKWHLGGNNFFPARQGYEINVGGNANGLPPGGFFSPYGLQPQLSDGPAGEYLTDRLTDEAIKLVQGSADGRPFFLSLNHYAPHVPIEAPADLIEKYRAKAAAQGLDPAPLVPGENFPVWHQRNQRVVRRTVQSDPEYAAMVESIDTNIGRLLEAITSAGKSDNTLVVFTSDNGGVSSSESSPTCNAPLREGKGWMYEGGIRVPLIVHWPAAVTAATTVATPAIGYDLYPTLLAAAAVGVPAEQAVEGQSLWPVLDAPSALGRHGRRRPLFWHYPHYSNQGGTPAAAVREGDVKLIRFYEDEHVELYDLAHDPGEASDLAGSPRHRSQRVRLERMLERWLQHTGAIIPRPNPFAPFADLPGDQEYQG